MPCAPGYGHLLPRGLLREHQSSLKRADLILITRADKCSESELRQLREELGRIRGTDESVEVAFLPVRMIDLNGVSHDLATVKGKKTFAFCGIGNPAGFRQTVMRLAATCEIVKSFSDHHHYSSAELQKLGETASRLKADFVLTTQKDLVKIMPAAWTGPPLMALELGVQMGRGQEFLESHLRRLLTGSFRTKAVSTPPR